MNRQLRRGGGIMTVAPREKFGLGSSLKKAIRKFIPNEVSKIAVKAAPFVAPFNPAVAGVMAGLGRFDQTGRIGKSLKAGALTYGGGQLARYVGGGANNLQGMSFKVPGGSASGFGQYFSSPIQNTGGIGKMFSDSAKQTGLDRRINPNQLGSAKQKLTDLEVAELIDLDFAADQTLGGETGLGKSFIDTAKEGFTNVVKDVLGFDEFAAFKKDPMNIKNAVAIFTKNPTLFIGVPTAMAYLTAPKQPEESEFDFGKRKEIVNSYLQRYYSQANPTKTAEEVASFVSDNTREYSAKGGLMGLPMQQSMPMGTPRVNEGGVTELDYRAEGGFVPVGIKEKADDVPAMLSKNEFVMTADAVRSAGNGSIEKGAQKMYDTMKQLESRVV